uniref:DNA (cytosine-5)-methyltransferase n=1 Tax=Clastoptera arizonana TaxID=38151 RepID=A0A1B6C2M8_9HEMI
MPSVIPPNNTLLPEDVIAELEQLDSELQDGDVTTKGYCKKKWKLLEAHVESNITEQINKLQSKLKDTTLTENDYYVEMMKILQINSVSNSPKKGIPLKTELTEVKENGNLLVTTESITASPVQHRQQVRLVSLQSLQKIEPPHAGPSTSRPSRKTFEKKIKPEGSEESNGKSNGKLSSRKNGAPQSTQPNLMELFDKKRTEKRKSKHVGDDNLDVESVEEKSTENGESKSELVQEEKKIKLETSETIKKTTPKTKVKTLKSKGAPPKCDTCKQLLDDPDLKIYPGHPNNSVEEFIALTDPKLSLFTGEESNLEEFDERPTNKITQFSVYDKKGHLVPFDTGLIEANVLLYFSGYLKPVYEENSDAEGGIPTKDLGPINEWWFSGFDGGERALLGLNTGYGEYYLMEPSEEYAPLMKSVREKIYMGKLVIEILLNEVNPTYEDLLNKLQTTVPPSGCSSLSEETLLRHAQFVCDHVLSFDAAEESNCDLLITTPCMRALVNLAGVTFFKRRAMRKKEQRELSKMKQPEWTKATTTPLVTEVFETLFPDQLDKANQDTKGPRRKRCGVCEACQYPDCGTCPACVDMVKFGGSGRSKQACAKRRCPNMAVQEADDSEDEDDFTGFDEDSELTFSQRPTCSVRTISKNIEWIGKPIEDGNKHYYTEVKIGEISFMQGDFVMVEPNNPATPVMIAKLVYMWEDMKKLKRFHAEWFCRGTDTVLGETADPQEIFEMDECEDSLLTTISDKAKVVRVNMASNWAKLGGGKNYDFTESIDRNDKKAFFYQKRYDSTHGRFEDLHPPQPKKKTKYRQCDCCERIFHQENVETAVAGERLSEDSIKKQVNFGIVRWRGVEFRPGNFVFLAPKSVKFKYFGREDPTKNLFNMKKGFAPKVEVDEEMFPEFYRKSSDHIKGSNDTTPSPFVIGYIKAIVTRSHNKLVESSDICLQIKKMYRPENTHKGNALAQQVDLNMVYWSDEECIVNFEDVAARCFVVFSENLDIPVNEWTAGGPNRFYFNQAYDSKNKEFVEVPTEAALIGCPGKGKGKGKGKSTIKVEVKEEDTAIQSWPKITRPLRCLDVFAGCGGLSEGLHQSGVAKSMWAIEKEEPAANAFKLNNPECTVFTEDCNQLLKDVMDGKKTNCRGQKLPQKGEVELLCGGPPCQGFSGMNRFNSRQYSLFKNSLIVSYLSYCEYYRPKFFILENVRNFVSFKRSMVLKLTIRCLLRMGYQCTFGVLQAGQYGVPQTRRRAIIMAAAPGEVLPLYPEPTHTFNPHATQLSVMVDDMKYISNCRWTDSAPRRTITVRDAMSDLPEIRNGAKTEEMPYGGDPSSHFQKLMRGKEQAPLRDHICKEMAPIVEARMAQIPTSSGSDWRDLPNIVVQLSDGTFTKKLQYTHHDKKNGKSPTGALRGVCSCASEKPCDSMDKQFNTLIPWCLPHTGNRHNHWAGLYGRLEWDGFFSTTVTNPEPMGKQGRVLHPEQTRVVSVRECARSQGFPDSYRFYGNILDKHRQIGNAVPPPLGAAIGYEIRKSVANKESKDIKEAVAKEELKIKDSVADEELNDIKDQHIKMEVD